MQIFRSSITIEQYETEKNILNVFYDKEADVLYMSQGKPSPSDETSETKDEVVVRKNPKTGAIKGFTILNFLKRSAQKSSTITLPSLSTGA